jgi:hypothetical protein
MFLGWIERWPMKWDYNGSYAQVTPDVVDSFAVLSHTILKAPFYLDVLALSPAFFFPLNDPAPSSNFVDITNNHAPAPVVNSPYGLGTVASGSSLTSAGGVALTNEFLGAAGPVVTMTNSNAGGATTSVCSGINLTAAGVNGVPATGGWTRQIAFRNTGTAALPGAMWYSSNATYQGLQNLFFLGMGGVGFPGFNFEVLSSTAGSIYDPPGAYADGNWHLMHVVMSANNLTVTIYVDGISAYANTTATSQNPTGITQDTLGMIIYPGISSYYDGYNGDMAHVAQFNTPLTLTQIQNLYASWRTCWNGDTATTRYQRILGWSKYVGLSNIDTSATTSMGPAIDLVPTNDGGGNLTTSGTDALTALTNVVITENGNHFIDANGVLQFRSRTARYQPFIPQVTFGENTGAGEIPYEDVQFDFDTTQVGNDCQVTRNYTSQVYFAEGITGNPISPTSQGRFGVRTLQRTVNTNGNTEPQDAANFFLYRYGQADVRISSIVIHVSALYGSVPTAWGQMLGLELGAMVTVNRRAPGDPVISWNGFVESIKWDLKAPRDTYVTLQMSPADKYQFWIFSALYGTLNAQATAGANTAIINPLPDSASNPAKCSFPQGQTVLFEPLTARSEIAVVNSVGTTTAGYTSATLHLDRNLAFTHALGSTWIGYESPMSYQAFVNIETQPSYYDGYSKLGQTTIPAY